MSEHGHEDTSHHGTDAHHHHGDTDSHNKGASVFKTHENEDGTKDEYFNRGSQDGGKHGHRVTENTGEKDEKTIYVRDNDGVKYDTDDN